MTAEHAPQAPAEAAPLSLSKKMSVERAFQRIAIHCLQQMQANSAGIVWQMQPQPQQRQQQQRQQQQVPPLHQPKNDAENALQFESVHQLRVGLRQLRTLLDMFKSIITPSAQLQQEIDWLALALGAARDWDVLASATLPQIALAAPDETGLATVLLAATCQAKAQHHAAAAVVATQRFVQLMSNCTAWVEERGWRDPMTAQQRKRLATPITDLATSMLQQQQRRLHKRADTWMAVESSAATPSQATSTAEIAKKRIPKKRILKKGTPRRAVPATTAAQAAALRHRVRIAAKKTRYACEFFQSLSSHGHAHAHQLERQLAALSKLQDQLGWLNDAATAMQLLVQLQQKQPTLSADISFIRGYLAACINRYARRASRRWKKFPMQTIAC
jgi:CHAD domain-containing protein